MHILSWTEQKNILSVLCQVLMKWDLQRVHDDNTCWELRIHTLKETFREDIIAFKLCMHASCNALVWFCVLSILNGSWPSFCSFFSLFFLIQTLSLRGATLAPLSRECGDQDQQYSAEWTLFRSHPSLGTNRALFPGCWLIQSVWGILSRWLTIGAF